MRLLQRRTDRGVWLHALHALAGQHAPHVALVHGERRPGPQRHEPGHPTATPCASGRGMCPIAAPRPR